MNVSTDVLTNADTLVLQGQIGKTRAAIGFKEQVVLMQNIRISTCSTSSPESENNIASFKRSSVRVHRAATSYAETVAAEVGRILHTVSRSNVSKLARTVKLQHSDEISGFIVEQNKPLLDKLRTVCGLHVRGFPLALTLDQIQKVRPLFEPQRKKRLTNQRVKKSLSCKVNNAERLRDMAAASRRINLEFSELAGDIDRVIEACRHWQQRLGINFK